MRHFSMDIAYLDNAATTPVLPEVAEAMRECLLHDFGNPSSLHRLGIQAEKRIESVRQVLAKRLGCQPENIFFTSGGTESDNLAIKGAVAANRRVGQHVLTTPIEHPAVLNTCQALQEAGVIELEYLPVDNNGVVSVEEVQRRLRPDTVLVSVMYVNNETGSIQPVERIGELVRQLAPNCLFHVDGVQAVGKLAINLDQMPVDLLTISGHKLHGPKGVGALYVGPRARLLPQMHGGGQERGLRSGTENVPGIVGFGAALESLPEIETAWQHVSELRAEAWESISQTFPDAVLNGSLATSSPYILNVGFPGLRGEVLVHYLENSGVYVSTGSACSSRRRIVSHVLEAMGVDAKVAEGSIRISFSHLNTHEDVSRLVTALTEAVSDLRFLLR